MAKTKLTKQEATALLVVMRKELEIIFEELELSSNDKAKAVLDNLAVILKKGLKTNPDTNDIYKLFE
jgi:hypothetical protein